MNDLDDIYGRLARPRTQHDLADDYRAALRQGGISAAGSAPELDQPISVLAAAIPPSAASTTTSRSIDTTSTCLPARGGRRGPGVGTAGAGRSSPGVLAVWAAGARSSADRPTADGHDLNGAHRLERALNVRNVRSPLATVLRTLLLR